MAAVLIEERNDGSNRDDSRSLGRAAGQVGIYLKRTSKCRVHCNQMVLLVRLSRWGAQLDR